MSSPKAFHWIKTECGRAKYIDLASRSGIAAKFRLGWFVIIAAARDFPIPNPDWSYDACYGKLTRTNTMATINP